MGTSLIVFYRGLAVGEVTSASLKSGYALFDHANRVVTRREHHVHRRSHQKPYSEVHS